MLLIKPGFPGLSSYTDQCASAVMVVPAVEVAVVVAVVAEPGDLCILSASRCMTSGTDIAY